MSKYNKVTVNSESDKISINPEFVYLTIPREWVCVYHKLLVGMADLGKSLIDNCSLNSNSTTKIYLNCWNLFQSALAAKEFNRIKDAEFLIDYIKKQLSIIYKGRNDIYNGTNYYPITEDGKIKALVSCNNELSEFLVDVETGKLYEEHLNRINNGDIFTLEDDDLIVHSNNKI